MVFIFLSELSIDTQNIKSALTVLQSEHSEIKLGQVHFCFRNSLANLHGNYWIKTQPLKGVHPF
jgi:hypothetical protein